MIFLYEQGRHGIRIVRAYGWEEAVEIPKSLQGQPVTELHDYAFSGQIDRQELKRACKEGLLCHGAGTPASSVEDLPEIAGERLREIYLPETFEKIGRYAFYNCSGLWKLSFFGGLRDIGAGAFTGCHRVGRISAGVNTDGSSCLRELLTELPEKLCVDLKREGIQGRFWFPEFFEEGVENTPARILENHVHGSGIRYRNCFLHKSLNIREYDKMFAHAKAWENKETVMELALGRLLYPMELTVQAQEQYLAYLREELTAAAGLLMKQREYGALGRLLEKILPDREETERILEETEERGDTEGVSLLMDYLHRHTKKQRKVFEL